MQSVGIRDVLVVQFCERKETGTNPFTMVASTFNFFLAHPPPPPSHLRLLYTNVIEQCASLSCQIVEEQNMNMINYIPPCNIWLREIRASLKLTFVHGNRPHEQQPIMINVSHLTTRIAADGNFFFRSMSLVITCMQDLKSFIKKILFSPWYPPMDAWNSI